MIADEKLAECKHLAATESRPRVASALYALIAEVEAHRANRSADLDGPKLLGWTWRAHLDDMLIDVHAKRWLQVADKLTVMLQRTITNVRKANP